jgi:hypothetical protein
MNRRNPPDATHHLLRVAMGKQRKATRGRVDNSMVPKLRKPSMPALPEPNGSDAR